MTRSIRRLVSLAAASLLVLGLAGCMPGPTSLEGTHWKLTEWTISSVDPATVTITANFAKGRISGSGGVNTYGGPYKAGPGSAFSAGPLTATQMAGPDPAMRGEVAYLALLAQAAGYKLDGDKLTLLDKAGNDSLIFHSAPAK